MSEVDVTNQTPYPVNAEGVGGVVAGVLESEGVTGAVDVALLSPETMTALNERYRGVADVTDVLSYPGGMEDDGWPEPTDAGLPPFLGDVLVCPAVAQRHAEEDGLTLGEEILHLLVHGTLHLLGYDHEVDEGEMGQREDSLRAELSSMSARVVEGAVPDPTGDSESASSGGRRTAGQARAEHSPLDS